MAKKKNWLSKLKRLFLSDAHSKPENEKRRRWLFQRLKTIKLPTLLAPPPPLAPYATEDEPKKHDFAVAITTTASANAANAAAEVVCRHTSVPQYPGIVQPGDEAVLSMHDQYEKEIQELAAIKIQTAFRGYLARKALRALKGLVKLQAIVRGRAVRRQTLATLKCLQSIVSIQSQIREHQRSHIPTSEKVYQAHDYKEWQDFRSKVMKIEMNSPRRWDDSILTKEEANAVFLSKKEAILKRERIKEYALSHRKSADQEQKKVNKNLRFWLEQWVDKKLAKIEDLEQEISSVISSNPRTKHYPNQYRLDGLVSPISAQRRRSSFHQKQLLSSKVEQQQSAALDKEASSVPTYMAATESAKNKTRSMGYLGTSPARSRPVNFDTFSEGNSPYKNKLSVLSSVTSEAISSGKMAKFDGFNYKSPSMKGFTGNHAKLSRVLIKDQSFDSDCSLFNWDRYSSVR